MTENRIHTEIFLSEPECFNTEVEVAAGFLMHNGKFLQLRRAEGKLEELTWALPAGKLEAEETILETVIRETLEETGITLSETELQEIGKIYVRKPHGEFVFHIFFQTFTERPDILLSNEHDAHCWVSYEEAIKMPLISGGKEALDFIYEAIEKRPPQKRRPKN